MGSHSSPTQMTVSGLVLQKKGAQCFELWGKGLGEASLKKWHLCIDLKDEWELTG